MHTYFKLIIWIICVGFSSIVASCIIFNVLVEVWMQFWSSWTQKCNKKRCLLFEQNQLYLSKGYNNLFFHVVLCIYYFKIMNVYTYLKWTVLCKKKKRWSSIYANFTNMTKPFVSRSLACRHDVVKTIFLNFLAKKLFK